MIRDIENEKSVPPSELKLDKKKKSEYGIGFAFGFLATGLLFLWANTYLNAVGVWKWPFVILAILSLGIGILGGFVEINKILKKWNWFRGPGWSNLGMSIVFGIIAFGFDRLAKLLVSTPLDSIILKIIPLVFLVFVVFAIGMAIEDFFIKPLQKHKIKSEAKKGLKEFGGVILWFLTIITLILGVVKELLPLIAK